MPLTRVYLLTSLAMVAFAGNSLLCRLALDRTQIDPATFTLVRIVSGAMALWLIVRLRPDGDPGHGSWPSAFFLFAYAAGFSFSYVSLPTATGALLLFGAVQATMIGYGIITGERLGFWRAVGLLSAIVGLTFLLLPGLSAPPIQGAMLMSAAGISWGIYSLRGRGVEDPTCATAGNFLRAIPFTSVLTVIAIPWFVIDVRGLGYAVVSGALTSGVGYSIWYTAIRRLNATTAATVQLSVPVIAAVGGIAFLGEEITPRLIGSSLAILGGIALVILSKQEVK